MDKILKQLLKNTDMETQGLYFENYSLEVIAYVDTRHKPDLIFFKMRKPNTDDEWLEMDNGFSIDEATMFLKSIYKRD